MQVEVTDTEVNVPLPGPTATSARDWLTHPVTCVALVVLVVNDHLLKPALGTWWTGKLSDVAWLVVVPPLLAAVVAGVARLVDRDVSARACATTGVALAGAVFAVVKTTPLGAHLASSVLSAVAGPSRVLADPTDLLALPALVLAWHVATHPRARALSRRRELRWLVMLPLVVVATAATSPTPEPEGAWLVVVVDDGRLAVDGTNDWHVYDEQSQWTTLDGRSDETALWEARAAAADRGGTVCTASGATCFRVAAQGVGVDRSVDGGDTWQEDWAIPAEVARELAERYGSGTAPLRTGSVAILPTRHGYRVYAANGVDGLAVRDEHGTWTRIGQPYLDPYVVPLPSIPPGDLHPLPVGATLVVPAALVLLVLTVRRRHGRSRGAVQAAWWLAVPGAALAILAVRTNLGWGPIGAQWVQPEGAPDPVAQVLTLALLVVVSSVLVAVAAGLLHRRAAWLVAAVAVGVGAVVELVSPLPLVALAAGTLLAAGVGSVRRTTRPASSNELPLQ